MFLNAHISLMSKLNQEAEYGYKSIKRMHFSASKFWSTYSFFFFLRFILNWMFHIHNQFNKKFPSLRTGSVCLSAELEYRGSSTVVPSVHTAYPPQCRSLWPSSLSCHGLSCNPAPELPRTIFDTVDQYLCSLIGQGFKDRNGWNFSLS